MTSFLFCRRERWAIALFVALAVWPGSWLGPATAQEHGAPAAATHGEEHGNSNPLSVDPDLAIFTAIVFVVLLVVLGKFAWGPIMAALDKREHMIAEQIAASERAQTEARRLLEEYERKLANAHDQVRALLEEGRREAEQAKQNILTEAKAASKAEQQRGVHEIELATDRALRELGEASANMAVDLAGKIVRAKLNPAEHQKLIQEALAEMQKKAAPSKN
jgi:F-type H+-transporting ATPase subunit b